MLDGDTHTASEVTKVPSRSGDADESLLPALACDTCNDLNRIERVARREMDRIERSPNPEIALRRSTQGLLDAVNAVRCAQNRADEREALVFLGRLLNRVSATVRGAAHGAPKTPRKSVDKRNEYGEVIESRRVDPAEIYSTFLDIRARRPSLSITAASEHAGKKFGYKRSQSIEIIKIHTSTI